MGRFHYWLRTGQVTKLLPVLHRLPLKALYCAELSRVSDPPRLPEYRLVLI